MGDPKDLESFLSKVDSIEAVIKGLSAGDDDERGAAQQKADQLLAELSKIKETAKDDKKKKHPAPDRTGVNRSVINQAAFDDSPPVVQDGMSQEAFMSALEKDAEERGRRRQKNMKEANEIKEKGNVEFRQGNYEKAAQLYTQAIEKVRDNTALYTNRAQAYNKLGRYEEALKDCDWAIRVFENCLKAYIHQGKAYLGLKNYDAAVESYEKARKIDPTKEKVINDYIAEVELARRSEEEEATALSVFESGDEETKTIHEVIQKLQRTDQPTVFYCGGMRVAVNFLVNTNERTVFRLNGGLDLLKNHHVLSRCISSTADVLKPDEVELCCAAADMYTAACIDNEENQKQVMEVPDFPLHVLGFLSAKKKGLASLKASFMTFLFTLSQYGVGRQKILVTMEMSRLVSCLFRHMKKSGAISSNAAAVLNNLALEGKFKAQLRPGFEEMVLPTLEKFLLKGTSNPVILPSVLSSMTNLCGDAFIRNKICAKEQCWEGCCHMLKEYSEKHANKLGEETLFALLGLLLNLLYDNTAVTKHKYELDLCITCQDLYTKCEKEAVQERALSVIGNILPHSTETTREMCSRDITQLLVQIIRSEKATLTKPAVRCISACTKVSQEARDSIVENKGLGPLVELLKSQDEIVVGNAALCLAHLAENHRVCQKLVKTNIIQHLLVIVRDGKRTGVQENCAILIAKLTQGDTRHLERLHELHGIEILHSVMKFVKT